MLRDYDRAVHFTESQADSIVYFADLINHNYQSRNYPRGHAMALRLYGYYYENRAEYEKAVDYYMQTLDEARRIKNLELQINALTDLAFVYTEDLKQPLKAKDVYRECLNLNKELGDSVSLVYCYINMGAIYNRINLHDSALQMLEEGLVFGRPLEARGKIDLQNLYNNLGNTYYHLKKYDKALDYFWYNYHHHQGAADLAGKSDLWYDVLNLADSYTEKAAEDKGTAARISFDSAGKYAVQALVLAQELQSKSKESDSYHILSKYYQRRGDYRLAFEYQEKWYKLDTALVNGETYTSIAGLEAKYEARKRENEKLILMGEVSQQRFHSRIMMVIAVSLFLVALAAGMAFMIKQGANKKLTAGNELVTKQNEKLSELNYEKNSLISIVSHDLSTPFASIGMWNQLLQSEDGNLTAEQKKALGRISQATQYGEKLIRHILDVEKAQTNVHMVQLDNLDLREIAAHILDNFQPAAQKKEIRLHLDTSGQSLWLLSDRQLLSRMLENILSNAIKYTAQGRNVWVQLREEGEEVIIRVKDEGVGIEEDELPRLFSKYSKISSQPTNGEASTGLGLAIVKRIVEELNGRISCESKRGEGSVFTIVFSK